MSEQDPLIEMNEIPPEIAAQLNKLEELSHEKESPVEQEVPEVHLLMSMQKNLFCDAAFQAMALAMLGTVFKRSPDLNELALYTDQTFSAANNHDWADYYCNSEPVVTVDLCNLPAMMGFCMDEMERKIRTIVDRCKIVMGTLRVYANYNPQVVSGNFTLALVWIEKGTK